MIDLTIMPEGLKRAVDRARERNVIIPTFSQMANPGSIPAAVKEKLSGLGLWDVDPSNLFRISWHNEPTAQGGGFGPVNHLEIPSVLSGVPARIVGLAGKWFPTGAHKVGAAFGCLVPRLVTGQFDPSYHKAVWPSTGNYCRGGAYDSALLGCDSVAILPEGMSEERFSWLSGIAGEVIKTPGSESNVKEIFDKCWELRKAGDHHMIFNQFEELGNYLWHHQVTGRAMARLLEDVMGPQDTLRGLALTTGSAGTIASGDYLKTLFPHLKIAASEALQCPTLLRNGFGAHRIEGIGDKHVPWIHNVRATDMVMAIDDEATVAVMRLFNEPAGKAYLSKKGVDDALLKQLPLLGLSGIANLLSSIKLARWYELDQSEVVLTVFTDSMDMYQSRLREQMAEFGALDEAEAAGIYQRYLLGSTTDHVEELTYPSRQRVHNLKYYTWVEQQGKAPEELEAQWYDASYWDNVPRCVEQLDELIEEFNARTGLLA